MRNIICSSLFVAAISVASSANAISKTDLDTEVKNTVEKCKAEVKGCGDITGKAAGILVFPDVTKGGIGIAYESGKGALLENGKTVGYYKTSSASLGATLGVGSKSVIVALKTPEELAKFKKSSGWEVGADSAVAMLDTGAAGSIDTNSIKADVVGIVFGETGVIADISVKGSKISGIEAKDLG
jgi:lipid-binding SYLF domain-containing protein